MASLWYTYSWSLSQSGVALDLGAIADSWGLGKRAVRVESWANAYSIEPNTPVLTPGVNSLDQGVAYAVYLGNLADGPSSPFSSEPGNFAYMASFSPGQAYPYDGVAGVFPPPPTDQLYWAQLWTVGQSETSHINHLVNPDTTLQVLVEAPAAPVSDIAFAHRTWGTVRVLIQDSGGA